MSHNPHDWSDGIPDCIIFASTADAERGAAMYRSMADALDAQEARIKALEGALRSAMGTMQATISRLNYMGKPAFELMDAMNNARALLGEE